MRERVVRLRIWARRLRIESHALYFAARDRRVPWYGKLLAGAVVAYAFSPIDLIPDFVPLLGALDDLVVVPLGLAIALRLIPPEVMAECRALAAAHAERPVSRGAAAAVIGVWLALAAIAIMVVLRAV